MPTAELAFLLSALLVTASAALAFQPPLTGSARYTYDETEGIYTLLQH